MRPTNDPIYPPLPCLAPATEPETAIGYGLRVLSFVLAYRCTATLSDADLELADHAYPVAVGGRDLLPLAANRLTDARHLILATLRARTAERQARAAQDARSVYPQGEVGQPGKFATLQPAPRPLAPQGVAIDPRPRSADIRF